MLFFGVVVLFKKNTQPIIDRVFSFLFEINFISLGQRAQKQLQLN